MTASVHCSSAWHMMTSFSVRCSHSTKPLAAGWWGVVLLRWMAHICARPWKNCDSNWRPWSVVIVFGHPKLAIEPESTRHSAVMSGMGRLPASS